VRGKDEVAYEAFFLPSWEGGVAAPTPTYNATSIVGAAGEVFNFLADLFGD
jgi:hypothetical protein